MGGEHGARGTVGGAFGRSDSAGRARARARWVAPVTALLASVVLLAASDAPAGAQADPAQQLAERFVPLVQLRVQGEPCGDGEPFEPVPVDAVLGRDDVVLRGPDGEVVPAPTAADLAGKPDGWHLDIPGDALDPGCSYETWADGLAAPPTVYARVLNDPDDPGVLALQYWLFWVYNDWNDKHEGDWEMVQLLFDAPSAEAALATTPRVVAFAQHEGAELASWGDTKLRLDGDRPVVFPAQGSHAAYFASERWFGKSAATGFGCDDTRGPLRSLTPAVVMLPEEAPTDPADPFVWLSFEGRWGEKQPSFNNGPTGPATKTQWAAPQGWVDDEGRDGAVAVPPLGSAVTDAFCSLSEKGSLLFIRLLDQPFLVFGMLGLVGVGTAVGLRRTKWRPARPEPLAGRRAGGEAARAAGRLVRHRWRLFGGIGVLLLAAGAAAAVLQRIVMSFGAVSDAVDVVDPASVWAVPIALAIGAVITIPVTSLVIAATSHAFADLSAGHGPTAAGALGVALRRRSAWVTALTLVLVLPLTAFVVVLIPLGLWLLARWSIAPMVAASEGLATRPALARSSTLTSGSRVRTLVQALLVNLVGGGLGPLIGTLVLLLLDVSFPVVNVVAGLVNAVSVPWAVVTLAYVYEDRRAATASAATTAVEPG